MIIQDNDPTVQPSFSLRNRMARVFWSIVWNILFRPSPRPFHQWRVFLLRCFGATVGRNVHVYPSVRIWAPWNLQIEDNVGVGDGAILYSMAKITLGYRCVVSQGAHLCTGSHNIDSKNFQLFAKPIEIDSFAWICAEAFVGPGVRVPEGVVVGARCVAFKSIDLPWTVWIGNPAEFVRQRQNSSLVAKGRM